jgi:hypothetical protein
MPRYFFNIHDGQDIPDDTGTVCADATEARTQAVIASGALLRDWGAQFWQGAPVCDLRFTGTISAA